MTASGDGITEHYTRGDLLERLRAALADDGVDPDRPTVGDLAPYDQFHGRGLEATEELVRAVDVAPGDHLLDVGSGFGGPARYVAERFGCRVTGIDLTAEFVETARHLTRAVGLDGRVAFEHGDALAMPFPDACFDGAWSMNVSMNIADKPAFYREIRRVVRPGGWLALSEYARIGDGAPQYPTPWAASAGASFLATREETVSGLEGCGFAVESIRETTAELLDFGARARAIVEAGGKPPHRAASLVHRELARDAARHVAEAVREGRIVPIEIVCRG